MMRCTDSRDWTDQDVADFIGVLLGVYGLGVEIYVLDHLVTLFRCYYNIF